jgi:hypothetical protein
MSGLNPFTRGAGRGHSLAEYLDQPFPTSDHVLLCSFGLDLRGERTRQQLRAVLRSAGFPGPVTRHLIGISPLLRRGSKGRYRLREFQP